MTNRFDYKVALDCDIRKARKWCIEEFGAIPVKEIRKKIEKNGNIFSNITVIYDLENASWLHRVYGGSGNNPRTFFFKNDSDAVAFKLRWI